MKKDNLGDRMKQYEAVSKTKLMCRTPVIIRLDGKAFHSYTKRFTKQIDPSLNESPFSCKLHDVMMAVSVGLCQEIQNAKVVYTQSDEISILLTDWKKLNTDQWFDAQVQKMVSVSASITTAYFNWEISRQIPELTPTGLGQLALFDSRVYNIPKEEVNNYFIWRQQDASRNSVQMLGQYFFSHKQMHGLSNTEVQELLFQKHGVNWNNIKTWQKRGACVYKSPYDLGPKIIIDDDTPIFAKEKTYIEQHLTLGE
jgi:tRNA(His) guanylyltransferase